MYYRKKQSREFIELPGVPFDPYGNTEPGFILNGRIMPMPMTYPNIPLNFSMIRNTNPSKEPPAVQS